MPEFGTAARIDLVLVDFDIHLALPGVTSCRQRYHQADSMIP